MQNFYDPKEYYKILEVEPNVDEQTLKKQYFKLAKFWHPDHNTSAEAMENFQKISVAYDTLKDEKLRLYYDLLSMVYGANNFPDIATMSPFLNSSGKLDLNVRSITYYSVIGQIIKTKAQKITKIMTFSEAKKVLSMQAIKNWLCGWWSMTAPAKNAKAISANLDVFSSSKSENLKIFIHNMIALNEEKKPVYACKLAYLAKNYVSSPEAITLLDKFIALTGVRPDSKLPEWNYQNLKSVQLIVPAMIGFVFLIAVCSAIFSPSILSHKNREINYNQTVRGVFGDTFDDVVVGKIFDIPVDTSDTKMLAHLKNDAKIMYGPDDNFDVLAELKSGHTVRVTGYTPDKVWYRVMIDSGQDGFVRAKMLQKGIGNEISPTSKIYKQ